MTYKDHASLKCPKFKPCMRAKSILMNCDPMRSPDDSCSTGNTFVRRSIDHQFRTVCTRGPGRAMAAYYTTEYIHIYGTINTCSILIVSYYINGT